MNLLEQLLNMYFYARTDAVGMVNDNGDPVELSEAYGKVIENYTKRSNVARIKAEGSVTGAASVEYSRFQNSESNDYGTARAAAAGAAVKDDKVTVNLDEHQEIVEEISRFDYKTHGVANLIAKRAVNHSLTMQRTLDRAAWEAAFDAAANAGNDTDITATDYDDALEQIIGLVETVTNDYVDGVPRDMIAIALRPGVYGKVLNKLDKTFAYSGSTEIVEVPAYHGVQVFSEHYLPTGTDFIVTVVGNIAQPVMSDGYVDGGRINLSNDYEVSLFYDYGIKILAEDLVFEGEIIIGEEGL
jgi:hypothetical protein